MIIWFSYIIPVLIALGLFVFSTKKPIWWEYLILLLFPIIIIASVSKISETNQTRAKEYWGGYVQTATYTEPWNEWISKTCETCTGSGKDRSCTSYDCSYCDEHGPSWDIDATIDAPAGGKEDYDYVVSKFGPAKFVDLDRNSGCSFPKNGNKYVATFDGSVNKLVPIFSRRNYENRIQAAPTLFSYREVDTSTSMVVNYPDDPGLYHSSILGASFENKAKASEKLSWYNGLYGSSKQVHAWLIVYRNKPQSIGQEQEAYWKGGGKNELIVTIGLPSVGDSIEWCYIFSWTPKKETIFQLRDSIISIGHLNDTNIVNAIGNIGIKHFVRKHFRDFKYIQIQPSGTSIWIAYILIILFSVGYSLFVTLRDRTNPDRFASIRNRISPRFYR